MVYKNYYKILGLETSRVSIDEIKVAYRNAAKKYHPDLNIGDKLSEEKIKDINEAYRTLSVPASKRKYDRIWNSRFSGERKAFDSKTEKNRMINIFLGNIENKELKKVSKMPQIKGENITTQINASIYEAFFGQEKKIALKGEDEQIKTFTINIPKGIRDGEKIRLIGQGKKGKNGGKNGDLLIEIKIEDDSNFKLNGKDIYTNIPLTPWEAALGTKTNLQTIDEETKVYIPAGIQSGEKIKIPEKGYISTDGTRGDLIAEVKIMVPKKMTVEEKKIFEKLSEISKFNPRSY